jgi:hypothetical protein
MKETEQLDRIVQFTRDLGMGWRFKHDRHAQSTRGYRTPVQYHGQGWPDVLAVHPESGDLFVRELKQWARRNVLGPGQQDWLQWLQTAGIDVGQAEPARDQPVGIWTERDWETIIVPRLLRPVGRISVQSINGVSLTTH